VKLPKTRQYGTPAEHKEGVKGI